MQPLLKLETRPRVCPVSPCNVFIIRATGFVNSFVPCCALKSTNMKQEEIKSAKKIKKEIVQMPISSFSHRRWGKELARKCISKNPPVEGENESTWKVLIYIKKMSYCWFQWKGINRKQSTRWQHLSRLKASAFFSLQNFFTCYETQQLILGTGTAIRWVTEPHYRHKVIQSADI